MENPTTTGWIGEATPQAARLGQIRRTAQAVHPDAMPQCLPAMLRDLQAENDRLTEAARVQRAETLCWIAELLVRVDQPHAAEFVNAQILLEWVGNGHVPMHPDIHTSLLKDFAEYQKATGAALVTEGNCTALVVDQDVDAADVRQGLDILIGLDPRDGGA